MSVKGISPIQDVIEASSRGEMFILVDAPDRENEGDLVIAADKITADAINFMAKFGRGLICLALDEARMKTLGLQLMSPHNQSRQQTAFTISIEAKEGVSTGISAADRAHTIKVAIDKTKGAQDIVSPGHIFPLVAHSGGVLARAGHTEAAVDIARLAGLAPAGVICEILNDDGSMARLDDLLKFAKKHKLKIGTIEALIAYRHRKDSLIKRVLTSSINTQAGGKFDVVVFRNIIDDQEHIALVKGDVEAYIKANKPVLVRMHAENSLSDVIGLDDGRAQTFDKSLALINRQGCGVLVLIRNSAPRFFSEHLRPSFDALPAKEEGTKSAKSASTSKKDIDTSKKAENLGISKSIPKLREYGIGAQIILDLGLRKIELLSDTPKSIVALDGYDLKIVGQRPILDL